MNSAKSALCSEDPFNPLVTTTLQAASMLVISQLFDLILKPFGLGGPVAQILAGVLIGPSGLARFGSIKEFFISDSSAAYYELFSTIFRTLFMFLIGLEADLAYIRRNLRKATILAYSGLATCTVFGIAISLSVTHLLPDMRKKDSQVFYVIIMTLANTAAPVVIRLAMELKFYTAEIGRLAITTSLVAELTCFLVMNIVVVFRKSEKWWHPLVSLFLLVAVVVVNKYVATWCNQRNKNQKYVTNTEFLLIMILVLGVAFVIEDFKFTSAIACFTMGLLFPKEGKFARTLLQKLTFAVDTLVFPIYFGYTGFQFDVDFLANKQHMIVVVLMIFVNIGGKILGTLFACHHLHIPKNEGIVLALLLNLKGHAELLLFKPDDKKGGQLQIDEVLHNLLVTVIVLNTVISGPVVASILKKEDKYYTHENSSLAFQEPEKELRVLFCVYAARHIMSKIGLISALSGSLRAPISPYLMHLVELPKIRPKKELMYHELQDGDQFSDEEDYGGNDILEINAAVDDFSMETRLLIHQKKTVSSFATMYEDICDEVEDLRVSIVILTFHKHQRLDGKMESGKEGMRLSNQKVLRHASCSVGIFVDRGQTGFQPLTAKSKQNVAALFFGGPDDREALACIERMVGNPRINLTVIHFHLTSSSKDNDYSTESTLLNSNEELLMEIPKHEMEKELDATCIGDFHNWYVASGKVGYVEKYVGNGKETVEVLRDIEDTYSLFVVGRGGRGHSPMTTGMSDWEECPELGTVGDILSSCEFNFEASVLVVQQHRHSTSNIRDD